MLWLGLEQMRIQLSGENEGDESECEDDMSFRDDNAEV
jgi:hypothetical protein